MKAEYVSYSMISFISLVVMQTAPPPRPLRHDVTNGSTWQKHIDLLSKVVGARDTCK